MAARISLHPERVRIISEVLEDLEAMSPEGRARWLLYLRILKRAEEEDLPVSSYYALLALQMAGCPWGEIAERVVGAAVGGSTG